MTVFLHMNDMYLINVTYYPSLSSGLPFLFGFLVLSFAFIISIVILYKYLFSIHFSFYL